MRVLYGILFSFLLISACKDARRDALSILNTQSATRLREDARLLAAKSGGTAFEVAPELLPASFRAFAPVVVRYYEPGYGILVTKWISHETGIYVLPTASIYQPQSTPNVRYEKISDGVYWYEM
jgi:hypothetical protein